MCKLYSGESTFGSSSGKADRGGLWVAIVTICSPDFVYLLVIIVNKKTLEHLFAYFAHNDRNKWLQFDVAAL
jgi:hypothetical protein